MLQARIKIGKFLTDTEVLTTDIVEEPDSAGWSGFGYILRTKYLLSYISYEGFIGVRKRLSLRGSAEALLNWLSIENIFVSSEIQVRVYSRGQAGDREWSRLHDITVEDLSRPHPSRPHNKLIAMFLQSQATIESWEHNVLLTTAGRRIIRPVYEHKMGFYTWLFHERINERINGG